MPVPIYLEWEIKFNEQYLKGSLAQFVAFAPFYDICVRNKIKVTVNQMRALAAGKEHRHPDDRLVALEQRASSRGDLFVYDEAPDEPEDSKVPQAIAIYYVRVKALELGDETLVPDRKGCTGFLSFDQIKAQFPKLFDEAKIQTIDEYKAIFED